jgi:hypothetical protein
VTNVQEKASRSAAKIQIDIASAIAEQTAKAFDEQADFLEQIGRTAGQQAAERIVSGVTSALEPVIRSLVEQQLPAVVAQQADSLREVARALRASAS